MGTPLGLTEIERELIACARSGRELDLSTRPDIASRTVRARVIVDLATLPFAKWRLGPFRAKPLQLKGAVIVGGPPYFCGETLTRSVVLTDCRVEEPVEMTYRRTA